MWLFTRIVQVKLVCDCAGKYRWSQEITLLCSQLQAAQNNGHFWVFGLSLTDKTDIPST